MKKTNLEETVELAGSCYYTMVRSAVEIFPRETTGDLLGKKIKNVYLMLNAYPFQTAKRKFTEVSYGNNKAVKRVRNLDQSINKLRGLGTNLLGQYHSHTPDLKNKNIKGRYIKTKLSKSDVGFIKDELDELNKSYWIELTLNIKDKKYKRQQEKGESHLAYKRNTKKLEVKIIDTKFHGYNIIISAYRVTLKDEKVDVKELTVKRRKVKVIADKTKS